MEYVILDIIMYRLKTIRHILALECVMARGMSGGMANGKARGSWLPLAFPPTMLKVLTLIAHWFKLEAYLAEIV